MSAFGVDTRRHRPQHELKIWPEWFGPLNRGIKNFDLRRNTDRKFSVGNIIRFMEYDDRAGKLTGQDCYRKIVYIMEGIGPGTITPLHGLSRGYSILGLAPVE
jgi:hypothetical protein